MSDDDRRPRFAFVRMLLDALVRPDRVWDDVEREAAEDRGREIQRMRATGRDAGITRVSESVEAKLARLLPRRAA